MTPATQQALRLGALCLAATLLVWLTWYSTRARIEHNHAQLIQQQLGALVPAARHDNALHQRPVQILIDGQVLTVYRATLQDAPVAMVIDYTTPQGYSGDIRMLVAIEASGKLLGVRVLEHRETPGLGDDIELARSNWILGFDGLSLQAPTPEQWRVRKDGGHFDAFTGATITPRAVVTAVHHVLELYQENQQRWWAGAGANANATESAPTPVQSSTTPATDN